MGIDGTVLAVIIGVLFLVIVVGKTCGEHYELDEEIVISEYTSKELEEMGYEELFFIKNNPTFFEAHPGAEIKKLKEQGYEIIILLFDNKHHVVWGKKPKEDK